MVRAFICRRFDSIGLRLRSYKFRIFVVRFDVLRPVKEKWSIANIVEMTSKRIKFHFVSTQAKNDVWLEKKSSRIAPLHTHTTKPKPKAQSQKVSRPSASKSESKEIHDKQPLPALDPPEGSQQ